MSSTITIRDIDPSDKSWLQAEAKRVGLSMESYVRKIIEERHAKTQRKEKPSEVFNRYFGPENGVDFPELPKVGARLIDFSNGDTTSPPEKQIKMKRTFNAS